MSVQELREWATYYMLDPWGVERLEYMIAIMCSLLANINRDPREGRIYTPEDFLPRYGANVQTPEQQLETIKLWQAAMEAKRG